MADTEAARSEPDFNTPRPDCGLRSQTPTVATERPPSR